MDRATRNDLGAFKPLWPDRHAAPGMSMMVEHDTERDGWGMILRGNPSERDKKYEGMTAIMYPRQGIAATPDGRLWELVTVAVVDDEGAVADLRRPITDEAARQIMLAMSPLLQRLFGPAKPRTWYWWGKRPSA